MKLLLSLVSATALLVAVASAQTSSTTTTSTGGAATDTQSTTTTTEASGTVTEFTPGSALVLSTGAGEPVQYKFSKNVTYVTADGRVIEASKVRKNSKVRVHYIKEGGDMLVDKVIVSD